MADTITIPGFDIVSAEESHATKPEIQHPLDQLCPSEIFTAADLVRKYVGLRPIRFNCITLREPTRKEYTAYRSGNGLRPDRRAYVVVLEKDVFRVATAVINLTKSEVEDWRDLDAVAPILTFEDIDIEQLARADKRVIQACKEIGITDMSTVYFDGWAIGYDDRWKFEHRLQQALAYLRTSPNDNQYAHPLDFCVVIDTVAWKVISVDIRRVNGKRTLPPLADHNYLPEFVADSLYEKHWLKPIEITQPEGVSFRLEGNQLFWAGYQMHIGFNYREGIVLSDVSLYDPYEKRQRSLFNRISLVEMVVPYGCPDPPHHRKHALDLGEYGGGLTTNSLRLGCDCKGAIRYLDAIMSTSKGDAAILRNAICIHEEDNGLLYKHTEMRTGESIAARDRKLIVSQILTVANYDYAIYHSFTLDETAAPYGTAVAPNISAHNHQHIFSLRVDAAVDGLENPVVQNDAVMAAPGDANPHGNGFYCKKTRLRTTAEGAAEYEQRLSRTWDIINPKQLNPSTKTPVAYKIINNQCAPLLAQPKSRLWNRAAFATKSLWVLPYRDHELYPAGEFPCQSTGEQSHIGNETVLDWAARNENIENTDLVCYVQFGLTHFPRTEDFPIMPSEPVGVTLRASNFFRQNPALWVPPSTGSAESLPA